MASPLVLARNAIAILWEALTPPTTTHRTYRHLAKELAPLDGVSQHRAFWFTPVGGSEMLEFSADSANCRHSFTGHLSLVVSHTGLARAFEEVVNEGTLLARAINKATSWPANVDYVGCHRYQATPTESGYRVAFELVARVTEGD